MMRKFAFSLLVGLSFAPSVLADEFVRGTVRRDGAYVQPHWRSSPDGNPYNNWSYPGNVNPHTGKVAPGNPNTYLDRYYSRGSGTGGMGSLRPLPSLPALPALPKYTADPPAFGVYQHRNPEIGSGLGSVPVAPLPTFPSYGSSYGEDDDSSDDDAWDSDGGDDDE